MQRIENFKGPMQSLVISALYFLYVITVQALFCLSATEEIDCINSINYSQTRLTDTHLIWTPHYYRQFALSLGKESPQLHFL